MTERIIVVGGGPAGLMAAGRAAEAGARVLLIEKTPKLGNKLRMTGHGRGNITHAGDAHRLLAHLGPGGAFMREALEQFGPRELVAFFETRGMPTIVEADGRVLPASRNAHTILTALRNDCLSHNVTFRYRSQVQRILTDKGQVSAVTVADKEISAGAVILATGGMSYPATGSTGDGYWLATDLGHSLVQPAAGLVPLVSADAFVPELTGLSLRDVLLTARQAGEMLAERRGDMLFTNDGVSGPAALNLSLDISRAFERGAVALEIDLLPDTTAEALEADLQRVFQAHGAWQYRTLLRQRLPDSLVPVFGRQSGMSSETKLAEISTAQRQRIVELFKGLEMRLVAARPIQEAMVTLGGVPREEIDPASMASQCTSGLYFAGEIIDVAGETGGYNLQIAFTSGWLAGQMAARA